MKKIDEISYRRLKILLVIGLIILIIGLFSGEIHIIGIGIGIGFVVTDIILIYYKRKYLNL